MDEYTDFIKIGPRRQRVSEITHYQVFRLVDKDGLAITSAGEEKHELRVYIQSGERNYTPKQAYLEVPGLESDIMKMAAFLDEIFSPIDLIDSVNSESED
jgi:hypothetical protein